MMIRDKFEHVEAVAVVLNKTLLAHYKYTYDYGQGDR